MDVITCTIPALGDMETLKVNKIFLTKRRKKMLAGINLLVGYLDVITTRGLSKRCLQSPTWIERCTTAAIFRADPLQTA